MKIIAAGILAGLSVALASCAPSGAPRPNVIVIHIDDLGWSDIGANGSTYYETPNIDRLAREGMRFTSAYAAAAICSPTRAALMTGRYPARLGITDWIRARFQATTHQPGTPVPEFDTDSGRSLRVPANRPHLELSEVTMAELLKAAGYATAHVGKWHLGREAHFPEHQGFDLNVGGCDFGQPPSYFDPFCNERHGCIPTLSGRLEDEYLTDREADEASAFIRANRAGPFFLYFASYAVHTPIQAPDSLVERYERKPPTNQDNPTYAAMIEKVDHAVGTLLATLEQEGLIDQTLILFTSDNGGLEPVTDNAPLRSGKGSPYEGGLRVPLIVRWPGVVAEGRVSDVPAMSIDYWPTIAGALGLPAPDDRLIDGIDLMPVLTGGGSVSRTDLFWHFPHYRGDFVGPYSIVRSGDWKLIRYYDPEAYDVERIELFNLGDDPAEDRSLAAVETDLAASLELTLDRWLEEVGARMPEPAMAMSENR